MSSLFRKMVIMENIKSKQSNEPVYEKKPVTTNQMTNLTEAEAKKWVSSIRNSDGSSGELITFDQAKTWLIAKGYSNININDFYAMINVMKSDYSMVAKKFNITSDDFYGELAKCFIEDKDANPYKTTLYMKYIVKM